MEKNTEAAGFGNFFELVGAAHLMNFLI